MCLGGRSPSPPPPTKEETEAKLEREAQRETATAERKDARQDVLEENITRQRRGTGRRSLLRGSGGGIGFYNEYQD
tara:strand:+ start:639 stop:866 length:228 start_codon:yes stop_codon:yes gene_type:complete